MARDRRERRRRTHAMPRKHAALNGEVAHHSSGSRHTAHRQADTSLITKASRNAPALRRRVSLTLRPDRSPKLAGGEIAPDAPAWQIMIRGAQTPAFSAAVTFGLVLTWLGTEAPPPLHNAHNPFRRAQRETLRPAGRETLRIPAPTAPALDKAKANPGAGPTTSDRSPIKADINPKVSATLEQVLDELDQQARPPQPRRSPNRYRTRQGRSHLTLRYPRRPRQTRLACQRSSIPMARDRVLHPPEDHARLMAQHNRRER